MDKEKEKILENLRQIRDNVSKDLEGKEEYKTSAVQNVKYYGTIELTNKETGEKEQHELYTVEIYDYENDKLSTMVKVYLGENEIEMGELLNNSENIEKINDMLNKAKESKETSKLKSNNNEENKIYDLNGLEMEEYAKTTGVDKENVKKVVEFYDESDEKSEEENKVDSKKMEHLNYLQEMKSEVKVNNHETLSKVMGIQNIKKFVVVYSEDAAKISEKGNRNNSVFSMIAIKNDGTAINLDDKLEMSRSEGTNSVEERIQTDSDGTTRKESHQASIFNIVGTDKSISMEHDAYGEIQIYYGSMTKGAYGNEGNKFVGTQLETRNVWPTSYKVRDLENSKKGEYNTDKKAAETKEHFEHGDEKIEDIKNADGNKETFEICEDGLNISIINECVEKIMENDSIEDNYTEREVREYLIKTIEKHPEMEPEKMIEYVKNDLDRAVPERRRT